MIVAKLVGFCLIALATLHFVNRERVPAERSIFVGSFGSTTAARTTWAFVELAVGGALLLLV